MFIIDNLNSSTIGEELVRRIGGSAERYLSSVWDGIPVGLDLVPVPVAAMSASGVSIIRLVRARWAEFISC